MTKVEFDVLREKMKSNLNVYFYDDVMKVFDMAEKQYEEKPLNRTSALDKKKYVGEIAMCPCCKKIVSDDMLWCDDCGKKLDWS